MHPVKRPENLARYVVVDIETIPDQSEGAQQRAADNVKVPGNYSKPETVAKYIEQNTMKAWRDTALDATFGEIICIGYMFEGDDNPSITIRALKTTPDDDSMSEAEMLDSFFRHVEADMEAFGKWVGHNITNFDLPFLWRRAKILGVDTPVNMPVAATPWSDQVRDTSYMWTWEKNRGIKLETLGRVLGFPETESFITGATVWDAVQEERYRELAEYCAQDVYLTHNIYQRLS